MLEGIGIFLFGIVVWLEFNYLFTMVELEFQRINCCNALIDDEHQIWTGLRID